jgi:hypothetical protein
VQTEPTEVNRRRFTVHDYHRMGEAGILREDVRVELIDGELVEMTAIGSRRFACVNGLTADEERGRRCRRQRPEPGDTR